MCWFSPAPGACCRWRCWLTWKYRRFSPWHKGHGEGGQGGQAQLSPWGCRDTAWGEDRGYCWEWVGAKTEKGFIGVRWASGHFRRSFGKSQRQQEWRRTWWASRAAPKWSRVGCCSQRQGIIRPRRIIIPPVTPVLNREEGSVMALPAMLWSGPETPAAFGQNLWEKCYERIFLFCLKVHWTGTGGGKGEQSACKEQEQGSICSAYGKKPKGNVWKLQVCV